MNKVFTENGGKNYVYWQTENRKILKKVIMYTYWRVGIITMTNRSISLGCDFTGKRYNIHRHVVKLGFT